MKKLLSLLLVVLMLCSLMAGCAKDPAPSATPNDAPAADTPVVDDTPATDDKPADVEEPAADDTPAATDEPVVEDSPIDIPVGHSGLAINPDPNNPAVTAELLSLPLAVDGPTITFWESSYLPAFYESDYANTRLYDWVYDVTGVNILINNVSFATATEQFNLMLVSGVTDDIISNMSTRYTKGGQHAIDEGFILDLTDYVAQYMPNYQAMRAISDTHTRASMTDEGTLAYIYKMDYTQEIDWQGMGIRSDLLNELNLDLPVTYDDWTECLTAIHNTWGGYIAIPTNGIFTDSTFASGFGIGTQWYVVDGDVRYGAVEDGYKEYLRLFRDWYAAGLIDQDFMSRSFTNRAGYGRDAVVAFNIAWGRMGPNQYLWNETNESEIGNDNYFVHGLPHAVLNEGDTAGLVSMKASVVRTGVAITTAAEDPVLCAKFLDYFYSEEGGIQANYGKIGESCEIDENGKVRMTAAYDAEVAELIANETFTSSYAWEGNIYNHNWHENTFGIMMPERLLLQYEDLSAWEQCLAWAENSGEWNYPEGTQMTGEEAEEYGRIYGDAQTLIDEMTSKIITGMVDLDEGFEELRSMLKSIDFDTCIEIKQAAYDRYMAR